MEANLKIICVTEAIPNIKKQIALLCTQVNAYAFADEVIPCYWKCKQCSVYNVHFQLQNPSFCVFETELTKISGGLHVHTEVQGYMTELSCYVTISELLSNPSLAFITCYLLHE